MKAICFQMNVDINKFIKFKSYHIRRLTWISRVLQSFFVCLCVGKSTHTHFQESLVHDIRHESSSQDIILTQTGIGFRSERLVMGKQWWCWQQVFVKLCSRSIRRIVRVNWINFSLTTQIKLGATENILMHNWSIQIQL